MNKKLTTILSLLLFSSVPIVASAYSTIEVRTSAFFPMSHHFREIYDDVGIDYEVEIATTIPCTCIELWANFDWFSEDGHPKGSCNGRTEIEVANLSAGVKASCPICGCLYAYLGIGPTFGWVWVDNKWDCCDSSRCKRNKDKDERFAVGGVLKTGFNYYFTQCFFLDLFADYFYQPVHFHHDNCHDIGGFRLGAGLGFGF